jgi:hypothetical protein
MFVLILALKLVVVRRQDNQFALVTNFLQHQNLRSNGVVKSAALVVNEPN